MADIEMLQALHGDAFILHCQKDDNKGVIVIDGGPNRNSQNIVRQLNALGVIDLMVLTHYDDDHIGGILSYIKKHKSDRPFPVKKIWANCAYDIPVYTSPNISFGQAKKLAEELKEINEELVQDGFSTIDWETPIIAEKESITLTFADILILEFNL